MIAARIYDARAAESPYDTSGGMYAGGEAMTALGAFLFVALLPTLLALWFLRGNTKFWNAVAILSLVFAVSGLVAVLVSIATHGPNGLLGVFAVSQALGVPLSLVAFALFALIAPTREARRKLFVAAGLELAVGASAVVHFFVR
jgi:hypothetical protein